MFAAVIPASQANLQLPPTPPSGSGGEGDDDDGGVPLSIETDQGFTGSPRNRRVLRRVKANIHGVSPPPPSNSAPISVASDSTTTLNTPPTPPKEQAVIALHHPRPLSKSPKSAYFEDSFLISRPQVQQDSENGVDTYYYGAGGKEGYMEDKRRPKCGNDERDEEPFEVRRAESIKVTKAEPIKVRKSLEPVIRKPEEPEIRRPKELELRKPGDPNIRKLEESKVNKLKEPEVKEVPGITKVGGLVDLEKETGQLDISREDVPAEVDTGVNQVDSEEPDHQPELNRKSTEASLPLSSPTLETTIFSESEFETATEGEEEDRESDTETIVIKLGTSVHEQLQREKDEAEGERDDEVEDEGGELVQHLVTGKESRKPTPWPTPRVNSYDSISANRNAETSSPLSEDGDLVFHDALSSPLNSPVTSPRGGVPPLPTLATPITPKKKSEFVLSFGSTPTRLNPGDSSSSTSARLETPEKAPSRPPLLNIIPATPMPLMSPTAVLEKQLGDHSISLLQRKPTGEIPTICTTAPTIPLAAPIVPSRLKKVQRPSLQSQPKRLRESKLHPWWRPRMEGGEDEGLARTFSGQSQASELSVVGTDVAGKVDGKRDGRVTKKIKGTKFQIEFIGLGTLRDKVRVAGEKTSGLGRRMSLRKKV